jgi:hypothetical protein
VHCGSCIGIVQQRERPNGLESHVWDGQSRGWWFSSSITMEQPCVASRHIVLTHTPPYPASGWAAVGSTVNAVPLAGTMESLVTS